MVVIGVCTRQDITTLKHSNYLINLCIVVGAVGNQTQCRVVWYFTPPLWELVQSLNIAALFVSRGDFHLIANATSQRQRGGNATGKTRPGNGPNMRLSNEPQSETQVGIWEGRLIIRKAAERFPQIVPALVLLVAVIVLGVTHHSLRPTF